MKNILLNAKNILFLVVLVIVNDIVFGQISAEDVIKKSAELLRGNSQIGIYEMTVITPSWERTLRFQLWSEGTSKTFIYILGPAKDRGIAFLKINNEMWNFLPNINRIIKIPRTMMLQSWMGSGFTYDDIVKESSTINDYHHKLVGNEKIDAFDAYKVELYPKSTAPIVWSKIIEWIRRKDFVPLKTEYYNQHNELIRTLKFTDIKKIDGRIIPTRFELTQNDKPGHKTILIIEDLKFNQSIPKSIFTMRNLRRQ